MAAHGGGDLGVAGVARPLLRRNPETGEDAGTDLPGSQIGRSGDEMEMHMSSQVWHFISSR